jgi:hypothetical protein
MTRQAWSVPRIALALYPLGVGAMAVNVFFASLIFNWVGGPVLGTVTSIAIGAAIAVPATWAFARHIRNLMDVADAAAPTDGD